MSTGDRTFINITVMLIAFTNQKFLRYAIFRVFVEVYESKKDAYECMISLRAATTNVLLVILSDSKKKKKKKTVLKDRNTEIYPEMILKTHNFSFVVFRLEGKKINLKIIKFFCLFITTDFAATSDLPVWVNFGTKIAKFTRIQVACDPFDASNQDYNKSFDFCWKRDFNAILKIWIFWKFEFLKINHWFWKSSYTLFSKRQRYIER